MNFSFVSKQYVSIFKSAFILALGCMLIPSVSLADSLDEPTNFEIDAQALDTALIEFSEQADIQLVVRGELVADLESDGLKGEFTPRTALATLLDDKGLTYKAIGGDSVAVAAEEVSSDLGNARARPSPVLMAQAQTSEQQSQGSQTSRTTDDGGDEETPIQMDEIVVIGTNIRGISPDSSPSFTFDREDIAKTGVSTVSEFIQTLPQTFGGGPQTDVIAQPNDRSTGANLGGGSSVNLRGLGADGTLILLNGRRLAASGSLGSFTDISTIPLSAIERIEVLTDGASAVYGADAIGGVVNIVLHSDYVGAETFGQIGTVTEGDLMEYRAGQTVGKAWGSGNLLASYEFYHRDNLSVSDRPFSSSSGVLAGNNLLPEQQSHNVLLTGSQEIGNRIMFRAEAIYSKRDVDTFDVSVVGRENFFATENEQYGGAAGLEIDIWADWQLDVEGSYNKVSTFRDQTGFRLFQSEVDSELWSLDGKADGSLITLPGGDVKVAVGLSYRDETFFFESTSGNLREDGRNVLGVFGEAYVPIVGAANRRAGVERLELTLAGRYDDYNDFGDTFNPKVGLLWSPVKGLRLRGTYSTSFNPPNLGDTGRVSGGRVFVRNVPNPASATMTSLAIITNLPVDLRPEESTAWTAGVDYTLDIGPGKVDLAVSWFDINYTDRIGNAGNSLFFLNDPISFAELITTDPDPSVTANIIASAELFLNLTTLLPGFGPPFWTMSGDEEFILDGSLRNLAITDTSGVDVNLNYGVDTDFGQLNFSLNSSYILKQEKQITSSAPVFDVVDTIFNPADLRIRGSASWSNNGWSASAFVNYVDGYVDDRNLLGAGDVPVDSWITIDANLSFDTGDRSGRNITDNIRLSLSVQNLFDKNPPMIETGGSLFTGTGTGFDPTNADPLGRFVSFRMTKAW